MDIWAIERTIKYLHFACRTFLKNVRKNIKNRPNVSKTEKNKTYSDLRPPWIKNQVFL